MNCRAQAFPLGFGVLRNRGVTAWRQALTSLPGTTGTDVGVATSPSDPAVFGMPVPAVTGWPASLTTELINVLAAVALAGTRPDPLPSLSQALA